MSKPIKLSTWQVPVDVAEDKSKMVIVMRKDLKMNKGKLVSQGAHAAVNAILQSFYNSKLEGSDFKWDGYSYQVSKEVHADQVVRDWVTGEFTKITVAVDSLEELESVESKAKAVGLNVVKVVDNGHTCFNGVPTITCIAIGPCYSSQVDPITKELKLL